MDKPDSIANGSENPRELRRQARAAAWQQAAQDPLFLKDICEIEADFRYADAETAREIDQPT